ncbi:MAG TPA: hypothetical protein VNM66_03885, partial [Thermodesulfobacteriota bacterium]|nr:hypothetical protein [Thermodesulfobacteriota bacterium]
MPTDLAAAADELAPLAPAWQAVHAQSGSAPVFLTWGWQHAWWAHFGRGRPLRAVALADGGQPLALAPFFDDGGAWRLIGAPQDAIDLADYLDVLVPADREEAGWRALAAWLAGRDDWSAVVLDNVPAGSPTL